MIERDYIMRMIQMLVQVLARILFNKKGEQYPEALEEIRKASKQLLGVELDIFGRLSDTQMIEVLLLDTSMGIAKCYAAGMLLKEEADIIEAQKKRDEAAVAYAKSLSLLTEAAIHNSGPFEARHAETIDEIVGRVHQDILAIHIQKKLLRYYEVSGRYAAAEDTLFTIVEKEPGFAPEGILFYELLQHRSDEELAKGNFSRQEIGEGIAALQKLL